MKIFLFIIFFVFSLPSFSYNWSKCKAAYFKPDKPADITKGKILEITTQDISKSTSKITTESFTSTTSYVSSTGECRAFGMNDLERVQYIAETHFELQLEIAQGAGDHIVSLATLYGCNDQAKLQFNKIMKNNHSQIFTNKIKNDPISLKNNITDVVIDNVLLRDNCNPELIKTALQQWCSILELNPSILIC